MGLRKTTNLSILFQMYLRAVISVLYLAITFLINTRLFYIGKISDLGMTNGVIFFILFSVQIILLVVLTEGMNLYCDPVNVRNRGKYAGAFFVQLFMMGFPYILWKTSVISGNRQRIFAVLFFGMAIVVLGTHMQIIESYKKMTDEEVQELIAGYTMQWNEDLDAKCHEIRKKTYYFIGYMIAVGLLFQYVIANDVAAILFIGINMNAMVSWFRKPLRQFYALTAEPGAYRWGFVGGVAVSTIGYLFVYLLCQDVIRISFLQGRKIEEMGMLYLLFYVPFLIPIAKCHTMGMRMERVWER